MNELASIAFEFFPFHLRSVIDPSYCPLCLLIAFRRQLPKFPSGQRRKHGAAIWERGSCAHYRDHSHWCFIASQWRETALKIRPLSVCVCEHDRVCVCV